MNSCDFKAIEYLIAKVKRNPFDGSEKFKEKVK